MSNKKYTKEFKQQIVDLYNASSKSLSELESEYGVSRSTVAGWIKNLSSINISENQTITLKEYQDFQKKNRELELENEILKKATAIFARKL